MSKLKKLEIVNDVREVAQKVAGSRIGMGLSLSNQMQIYFLEKSANASGENLIFAFFNFELFSFLFFSAPQLSLE